MPWWGWLLLILFVWFDLGLALALWLGPRLKHLDQQ